MIKYRTKLIEKNQHGKSVSHLLKTSQSVIEPPVISCFGSYKIHVRELFNTRTTEYNSDGMPMGSREKKRYFTYSRNDGPIQRVVIDTEGDNVDWLAIDILMAKLDTELIRAQDGVSLAFCMLMNDITSYNQVIPDIKRYESIHVGGPNPGPLISALSIGESTIDDGNENPKYPYSITGFSGDGLFPTNQFQISDARRIAIPHPLSKLLELGEEAYIDEYPRWYPINTIQTEDNKITVYPSTDMDDDSFDLFEILGGQGEVPLVITSCVSVVPRQYSCTASTVIGTMLEISSESETPTLSPPVLFTASVNLSEFEFNPVPSVSEEGGDNVMYSQPYPLCVSGWDYDTPRHWPIDTSGGLQDNFGRITYWGCTFSKNGSAKKTIIWSPSDTPLAQHSVWDAIKELILDEAGRTAFVLSGLNDREDLFSPVVKSGISSNINYTREPRWPMQDRYVYNVGTLEVKDRVIQFADQNKRIDWSENVLTVYPLDWEDINQMPLGEVPVNDYYQYLCKDAVQFETGEPIVIHSCAVVEPEDLVHPNTSTLVDILNLESNLGLSCSLKLNDGNIKNYTFEAEDREMGLLKIVSEIGLLGESPITLDPESLTSEVIPSDVINKLYFRFMMTPVGFSIVGCTGLERQEDDFEFILFDENGTPLDVNPVILNERHAPNETIREHNTVTFIKNTKNGYTDLFDLLTQDAIDELTIHSSAAVPMILIEGGGAGGGETPGGDDMESQETQYMSYREPWIFKLTKTNGTYEPFDFVVTAQYGTAVVLVNHDTGQRLSSTFGRSHPGIIERMPENNGLDHRFDLNEFGGSCTFALYFAITGGSVSFTTENHVKGAKEGELEIIQWNSDCAPKVRISATNTTVKLPNYLPKEWRVITNMLSDTNMANPDISMWDVSQVVDMNYMFENAIGFNQDLSGWCVPKITLEPYHFKTNVYGWTLPKPVWGTCPSNSFIVPEDAFVVELTKFKAGYYASAQSDAGIVRMARSTRDWKLHDVSTGDLLADQDNIYNPTIIHDGNHDDTTYIKLPYNKKMTLAMTGGFAGIQMFVDVAERYSDDMTVYGHVNILQYPSNIGSIQHSVSGYTLNIPHELPSGMGSMDSYFTDCNLFNQDISHWDLSGVGSVNSMFAGAKSFNQSIGNWDVSNVFSMNSMFNTAQSFNQDLSRWCVRNIPELGYQWDYDTPAWTLPKPIWGTCPGEVIIHPEPIGDTMVFTVSADDNVLWNTSFIIRLGNVGDDWQLSDESGVIASPSYSTTGVTVTSGLYDRQVRLENIANKTNRYTLTISTDFVKLQYGTTQNEGDVNITVNVEKFSNTVPSYGFILPTVNLTVPESIPASVTSFEEMFFHAKHFNQDISMWDTSNVTNMTRMFNHAHRFDQDLSNWDVSNVTTMEDMFLQARAFNGDVTTWNVSSVTNMSSMFNTARMFNQDIGGWNVSNVISMDGMFFAASTFNQDLSGWNVANIPSEPSSFYYNDIADVWTQPKPNWGSQPVELVKNFKFDVDNTMNSDDRTFQLDLHSSDFLSILRNDELIYAGDPVGDASEISMSNTWPNRTVYITVPANTKNSYEVTDPSIQIMKMSVNAYNNLAADITILSFSPNIPQYQFNVEGWSLAIEDELPSTVTSAYMMFYNSREFNADISTWDVSNLTNMDYMLYGASNFNQDLSGWNVERFSDKPLGFDDSTNSWALPRPLWGGVVTNPPVYNIEDNFLPIDLTGQSGTIMTISKNGGPYQTFDFTDPSFNVDEVLGQFLMGETQSVLAFLPYPQSFVEITDPVQTPGLVTMGYDGIFNIPGYPDGFTPTKLALNPEFILDGPFYFGSQTNTLSIKATDGADPDSDLFNTIPNPIGADVVTITSNYIMFL